MVIMRSGSLSVVLASCVYIRTVSEDSFGPAVVAEEAAGRGDISAYPR